MSCPHDGDAIFPPGDAPVHQGSHTLRVEPVFLQAHSRGGTVKCHSSVPPHTPHGLQQRSDALIHHAASGTPKEALALCEPLSWRGRGDAASAGQGCLLHLPAVCATFGTTL